MINTTLLIEKAMKLRHLTAADISRKLNIRHSSVLGMLNRGTLQVQRLEDLSHAMKYNFFREIASKLDYEDPQITKETEHLTEVEQLKEQIKRLEIKVEVLEELLEKTVRKND